MRAPWRLGAFAVLIGACCAAELSGDTRWYDVTALLLAAGLALAGRTWLARGSGKFAIGLAGAAAVFTVALGIDPLAVIGGAARMSDVVILMLSIAMVRPIFAEWRLDDALAALLAQVRPALRRPMLLLAACLASLGLSFGAVGIFGASLGQRAIPEDIAPHATMRGLVLSMLLGPSTASVAAVMTLHPAVSWATALSLGVPLAVAGTVFGSLGGRSLVVTSAADWRGAWIALAILATEFAIAIFAHVILGFSMILAISLASVGVTIAWLLFSGRDDLRSALWQADAQMSRTWQLVMPEAALFLASGLVVGLMHSAVVAHAVNTIARSTLPSGMYGVAMILIAVPLITVAGIHPIVLFALLGPAATSVVLGVNEVGLYTMWVVVFMLSMLLSPVSVLTMVTVTNFGIPGRLLGLRGHGLYALALALTSAAAIAMLCRR